MKRLVDTFDSMLERLELAFDSQRLFAAHASHELRTPLTVLRAEAELTRSAHPSADAAGVTLDLELANAFVSGDAVLLRSLVSNLVENAISCNHSGGSVAVTVTFDHMTKAAELVVNNTGRHLATDEVDNLSHPAHHGSFAAHPRSGGGLVARVVLPAMDSHGT